MYILTYIKLFIYVNTHTYKYIHIVEFFSELTHGSIALSSGHGIDAQ